MNEVQGFNLTSLKAKIDQDSARVEEGDRLSETGYKKEQIANRYLHRARFFTYLTVIAIFGSHLFYENLRYAMYVLTIIAVFNLAISYIIVLKFRKLMKSFLDGSEQHLQAVWGSNSHPKILLVLDDYTGLNEIHIHREEECHNVGYVSGDDSIMSIFHTLEDNETN